MLGQNQVTRVELDNAFDQILQLADISKPIKGLEKLLSLRRQTHTAFLSDTVRNLLDKIFGKGKDIVLALPQGRQIDLHGAEPVEEICAELLLLDHGPDIDVGCGNDLHIHIDYPGTSQPHQLLLLHHPKELGLEVERHLADLV